MIAIVLGLAGEFFRGRHKPAKLTEFFISGESKKHDAAELRVIHYLLFAKG